MASKPEMDPPACRVCGGPTRLVGIEPRPDNPDIDVLTFECTKCGAYEIVEAPADQYAGPAK